MLFFFISLISCPKTPTDDREKSERRAGLLLHNFLRNFIAERIIATQMDLLRLLADGGVNGGINGGASSKGGGVNLEELIFETIQKNPGINAPAIADILQKSLRTTQRYLKSLSDSNRIAFRGAPKNGGYHVL